VLELRAYAEPVDAALPLESMTQAYQTVALVTIAHDTAYVAMTMGVIGQPALREFYRALADRGVRRVVWRRQGEQGVRVKVRGIPEGMTACAAGYNGSGGV